MNTLPDTQRSNNTSSLRSMITKFLDKPEAVISWSLSWRNILHWGHQHLTC